MNQPTSVTVPDAVKLALEHYHAGHMAEAEQLCVKILEIDPDNPDALHLSGVFAHLAGKQAFALAMLEKSVRLAPENAQFHYNLGVVYGVLTRLEEAAQHYRQALSRQPEHVAALNNLGNAALSLERYQEARDCYERLLKSNPDNAEAVLSLGVALLNLREHEQAAPWYERALALKPDFQRARWEYARLLLSRGEYARGWEHYEARFAGAREPGISCYPFPFPTWQGEPLEGKSILVHGEQGLGDEIMYASILPEIIAAAGRCVIACQPHLAGLFAHSFPGAEVHGQLRYNEDAWTREPVQWLERVGAIDFQVPAGSLPLHRRRSAEAFPDHRGYLVPPADKVAYWRGQFAAALPAARTLRVGLVWSSNPMSEHVFGARRARNKSMNLATMEPLARIGDVAYVSLQTWTAAAEAANPPKGMEVFDRSAELEDFTDTAAVVANLDLVISVDTSVAHLGGALGKPVWILLPYLADWRWLSDTEKNLWYPSACLFRQSRPGDWQQVMERVAAELGRLAGDTGRKKN